MINVKSKNHNFIVGAIIAAILICVYLYSIIRVEKIGFLGIADSKELQINFEYPVEIKRIHVIPGQNVRSGDLLLELDQSELNSKLREVEFSINRIESEMALRKQLGEQLGLNKKTATKELGKNKKSKKQQSDAEFVDPLKSELVDLQKEKDYLELKKRNLYIFSPADGVVGQINYKVGEKVNAFSTLITLSNTSPTFVTGFINENLDIPLRINQEVKVISAARANVQTTAVVKSIGKRTVEMPMRLLKFQNMLAYGREVTLELSTNNPLLIGEKVVIDSSKSVISFMAIANAYKANKNKETVLEIEQPEKFSLKKIVVPTKINEMSKFEPSGAIWLSDLNKYLVISDDTDENNQPLMFLLNRDGYVDAEPIKINNLSKIMDVESIAHDGKAIYILSSQSDNSSGDVKNERNLFVKIERKDLDFNAVASFNLRPLLITAMKKSSDVELQKIGELIESAESKESKLDIEGMTIVGNDFLIALKAPRAQNNAAIILRLANKDYIFQNKYIYPQQLTLEAKVNFKDPSMSIDTTKLTVSDLIYANGEYYIATTCRKADCSAIWKTSDLKKNDPKLLKVFSNKKVEGVAIGHKDELLGVFDEGNADPYYFINEKK